MTSRCSVVRDSNTLYIQIIINESTVIHDRIQINRDDLIHEDNELQIVGCTSYATAHEYKPGMLRRRLDAARSVLAR